MRGLTKNTDWVLVALVAVLAIIGIIAIYSSGVNSTDTTEYQKQIIWCVLGIVMMFVIWRLDYHTLGKLSYVGYVLFILLLVAVLFTTPVNNARSWFDLKFFTFQPSELMKIMYILLMAKVLDKINEKNKNRINKFKSLAIVFLLFAVPFGLIVIQPDFGTAIVFAFVTICMLFKAGISYKYILFGLIILAILAPIAYTFLLSEYQQNRIKVFLNPELDPLDTGYNAIQSKIAIGSGMWFGTGLTKGTQTQFGYLPVKSSDFIFSAISEELGFIMSSAIVVIYTFVIIRMINISTTAKDNFGSLVAFGIAAMFMFHMIENIGMTIGLLPITGIPLLLVSYGGTSMVTSFIAIGLLLSISGRRQRSLFID